jgi:hypothetical protein
VSCDLYLTAGDKIRVLVENPSATYDHINLSITAFL